MSDLTPEQQQLILDLAKAKVAKDAAAERYEDLAAQARDAFPLPTEGKRGRSVAFGPIIVEVGRNRTWNKAKALETYGDEICTMQVNLDKAREVMTGAEFEAFYTEFAPKITVKIS